MTQNNQVRGLDAILSGGTSFVTFEDGKPLTLLFVDWYENLVGIREHYEPSLNPKYIRCPGKEVCPLCHANPGKYPSFKAKFRVYDPTDNKVKMVSLAKTHIQKLNTEFGLEEIDPTKTYVTIYRTGKNATDTNYSARAYRPDPSQGRPEIPMPDFDSIDMPDLTPQVTAHSPEQITEIMNALFANPVPQQQYGAPQQQYGAPQQQYGQPQQNYGAPQQNFGAPQQNYGAPQQGVDQSQPTQGYDQGQMQQQGGYQQPAQGFNQPQQGGFPPQGGEQAQQRKLPF